MIRLFVALELPPATRARLVALGGGLEGARWVEFHNLHLTLRFIGEVDEAQAEDIHHELASIRAEPLDWVLSGLGLFGDRHRAHTLWAGVELSDALERLAAKVDAAVLRAGVKPDPKRYTPHVTLARLKNTPPPRIQAFMAGCPVIGPEVIPAEEFCLYRSRLGRHGPDYDVLERYPLGLRAAP
ncbi:2'-5' RNA ligase [Paramagnetospirillum marisnigri]|uniref:RNA 2',3'-cyclic phosphodiesterase n=1 Tax=Paramagnetospirillum marisnigri TaxID=1285242 RepID=A0A178MNJ6_9PROT|nr:RNA 2',3'-cyclic phosphodiesterase [Paramagnetospirillum marisnigri]OAN50256.1 2'-5' RNA ligase [Paramagnetospirillum marisnigri]